MPVEFSEYVATTAGHEAPGLRLAYIKVHDDLYMAKMIARSLFNDDTNQNTVLAIAQMITRSVEAEQRKLASTNGSALHEEE